VGATHNLARSNCDLAGSSLVLLAILCKRYVRPFGRVLVSDSLASLAEASFHAAEMIGAALFFFGTCSVFILRQ